MATQKRLTKRRKRRAYSVRKRTQGTAERPRLSVHRTNKHLYAQFIDDEAGRTLCAASTKAMGMAYGGNVGAAKAVGEDLGKKAQELKIQSCGFDRGSSRYHGRVRAFADAVREAGVRF